MSIDLKNQLNEEGFVLIKNFISKKTASEIKDQIFNIFLIQHNYIYNNSKMGDDSNKLISELYEKNNDLFLACSKQVQKLPLIYNLASSIKTTNHLRQIGMENPILSYTPLVMFNSKLMNKYITPPHQDWRSMQGSLDSLVIWIPFQDVYDGFGNIEFIPKSHKMGLVSSKSDDWFRKIDDQNLEDKFTSIEISSCDALVFSTFLIHRTGINSQKNIRWSVQFRYNNLSEKTYVERGFPDPYKHFPEEEILTKNFPSKKIIDETFNE